MALREDLDCVVFDYDGTLTHLDVDWQALRARLRVPDGVGLTEAMRQMSPAMRSDAQAIIEAAEVEAAHPLAVPAVHLVQSLRSVVDVIIFSRNAEAALERSMGSLARAHDIPLLGRALETDKPDVTRLHRHLGERGHEPSRVIVIGDTDDDVNVASRLGGRSIIVRNPTLAHQPNGADRYVSRLVDVRALLHDPSW